MNQESNIDSTPHDSRGFCARRTMKSLAWLLSTTVLYLVALDYLKHNPQWSPGTRVAVTLAPLLPGVFYLMSLLQIFRAMDELQRRIQLEALIFALAGTVVVNTVMNVLSANNIGFLDYPHGLEIGGVYMAMFILWSFGQMFSRLRYR